MILAEIVTGGQYRALRSAFKSSRKSPATLFKHGSVVIRGGNIVSHGYNANLVHAEVAAIKKLHPSKRKNLIVWVIRTSRGGTHLCESKPCIDCQRFMAANGVKEVFYSTASGIIDRMKM